MSDQEQEIFALMHQAEVLQRTAREVVDAAEVTMRRLPETIRVEMRAALAQESKQINLRVQESVAPLMKFAETLAVGEVKVGEVKESQGSAAQLKLRARAEGFVLGVTCGGLLFWAIAQ